MKIQWSILENESLLASQNLLVDNAESQSLVFKPLVFPSGSYTFVVWIWSRNQTLGGTLLGTNQLRVEINAAPIGRRFLVEPLGGSQVVRGALKKIVNKFTIVTISLQQMFDQVALTADSWNDPDLPLRYIFSVVADLFDGSAPFEFLLADVADLSYLQVPLPVFGRADQNFTVTLKMRVRDLYGAETTVSQPLLVLPPNATVAHVLLSQFFFFF